MSVKSAYLKQQKHLNEIEKAARMAAERAALEEWRSLTALFLIVLIDKFNFSREDVNRVHNEVCEYARSVTDKNVGLKMSDIFDTLKKEYGIIIDKEI